MYKVSVITPVYNVEKYIEKCAHSLFNQTLDDIEYIFVDDCSKDKSIEVLNSVIGQYPERKEHVTILRHEVNTGQSGARKDGMAIAKGEYIIHCDADDWVDEDMYECMYNKAKADNVEAVACDIVMEFADYTHVFHVNNKYDDHQLMYDCIVPISVEYLSMCNRMISRKVFERNTVVPFKGVNMWDDVGLAIRIRYYIQSTSVINKAFYHYNRLNETSTTRRPLSEQIAEQNLCLRYIREFFEKENALNKYKLFVSYLKIHILERIFRTDADTWAREFKPERKNLWKIRHLYKTHILVKYYTVGYGGKLGKLIWKKFWKR